MWWWVGVCSNSLSGGVQALSLPAGWAYVGDGGTLRLDQELTEMPVEPCFSGGLEVPLARRVSTRVCNRDVLVVGLGEPLSHAAVGTHRTPPQGLARLVVPGMDVLQAGNVAFIFLVGPLMADLRRAVLQALTDLRILPPPTDPASDPLPACPYLLLFSGENDFPFWPLPGSLPQAQPLPQPLPAQAPEPDTAEDLVLNRQRILDLRKTKRSMDAQQRGARQHHTHEHKA